MAVLENYLWPGNVRELENVIERTVATESSELITVSSLPPSILEAEEGAVPLPAALPMDGLDIETHLDNIRRELMRQALARAGGQLRQAETFEDNSVLDDEARSLAASGRLLRLRRVEETNLLTFKGPARFAAGVKTRSEFEIAVTDGEQVLAILGALGFRPVRRYQKRRETWRLGTTTVALDTTPVGCFVEVEGEGNALATIAASIGLDPSSAVHGTYLDLWTSYRAAHPEAPADMLFTDT
jgi:predicted adenylyl cyclase CyaB